jgi:hypothetical protein
MNKQLYEMIGRLTVDLSNKENELAEWKEKCRQLQVTLQLERINFKAYTDPIWDYSYQPAATEATTGETEEEFTGNTPSGPCDNHFMSSYWTSEQIKCPLVRQTCDSPVDDADYVMPPDSEYTATTPPPLVRNTKIFNGGYFDGAQ